MGQPAWCLDLLAEGEGRHRIDEVFLSRLYTWTAPPTALLAQVAPLKEAVLPLLGLCLAAFDDAPQHARRAQSLLAAMCGADDIFLRLSPLLPAASGSSLGCEDLCLLGRLMVKRVESVPPELIDPVYPAIVRELARLLAAHAAHASFLRARLAVHRCRDLLGLRAPPKLQVAATGIATGGGGPPVTTQDCFSGRRGGMYATDEYDPPGELSAEGRRHCNDHSCITRVAVVPTPDELVAERFPSLPRNRPDAQHHLPTGSIERLLDVHFRQLRHEAVYPLSQSARQIVEKCEQVQDIVRQKGSAKLDLQRQLGCREDNSATLFAFGGGAYMGVDIDRNMGVVHRFHVDDVRELQRRSLGYRRNAWKKGEIRLLTATDMVLVLRTDADARRPAGAVCITSAVVSAEVTPVGAVDSEELGGGGGQGSSAARIEVRLRFVDRSAEALAMFADVNGSFLLFDLRAGFFSFEPILESLREIDTLNASPVLAQLALTRERIEPAVPEYISSRDHLDFSSLLKEDARAEDVAWSRHVPVVELHTRDLDRSALLRRMTQLSRLDPGQMKAMLETLQRSMAITQGPPGIVFQPDLITTYTAYLLEIPSPRLLFQSCVYVDCASQVNLKLFL
jgi:hypothetical protein